MLQKARRPKIIFILEYVLPGITVPAMWVTARCRTLACFWLPYIRKYATSINYAPNATWSIETTSLILLAGKNARTDFTSTDSLIHISRKNSKSSHLATLEIVSRYTNEIKKSSWQFHLILNKQFLTTFVMFYYLDTNTSLQKRRLSQI